MTWHRINVLEKVGSRVHVAERFRLPKSYEENPSPTPLEISRIKDIE